ncbi:tyrosine-type recombinase/integrase [Parvibaculum sp.]|uniref:tyrosine-type recombinase/integrase n=1 Tax=Parvibaculum sp. TaxID=2024848 RepID=UPI00261B5085|nr:tyrosine-type recombinase/integrase [Parvibaculum sp.]MCW5726243.1 tyrosine-type recombinase/integrase [Parvibaculum sp.]
MLYDKAGRRKYLTVKERSAFIDASRRAPPEVATFCLTLAYTGARISEVLALTPERIDMEAGVVIIESLKKRRRGTYRAVPIPQHLLQRLEKVHKLPFSQSDPLLKTVRLWPCSRTTAWTSVKRIMLGIGIPESLAMPKALRHAFCVLALQVNVPLNTVQRWMGHSRITTTIIYADVVGDEERALANRMWLVR